MKTTDALKDIKKEIKKYFGDKSMHFLQQTQTITAY